MKGISNAEIGRLLGISRERVRQLLKKYQPKKDKHILELARIAQSEDRTEEEEDKLKTGLDELVRQAREREMGNNPRGRYGYYKDNNGFPIKKTVKRRLTDKRTLRKCIIAELNRLAAEEAQNERVNKGKE